HFSKRRIIEFYMNQIYLGRGSYGFAAAARAYFGKQLDELTVAEIAVLAGLPQAPSRLNPARNPRLAKERQLHVLDRMLAVGAINGEQHQEATVAALPTIVESGPTKNAAASTADYVAEEVRKFLYERYQDDAYELGLRVYTSINSTDQRNATRALRLGLIEYTLRHPDDYEGAEAFHEISGLSDEQIAAAIADVRPVGGLEPAVIVSATKQQVEAVLGSSQRVTVSGPGLAYVGRHIGGGGSAAAPIAPGAQVRMIRWLDAEQRNRGGEEAEPYWLILQVPRVEGALVAMEPYDGKVRAMVGGFDFVRNQYNHVTQARRQFGSSIKPFIYSAALEKGFTAATIIEDAPFFLTAEQTGSEDSWSPQNYDGKFEGPLRLRVALAKSKNLTTIRVLSAIDPFYASEYIQRFGFVKESVPPYLSMALGAGEGTPLQLAAGYSTFVNGGYLLSPSFIDRIEDYYGNPVSSEFDSAERVRIIDTRNAFMIANLLGSVVSAGTGARAKRELGRADLAGKTGTTNDFRDAWFAGFNPEIVAVSWVGFDTPRSLGKRETGSRAALPIWIEYMRSALAGRAEGTFDPPSGVVQMQINPQTGMLATNDNPDAIAEYFYEENMPGAEPAEHDEILGVEDIL
ncbi:MAG: penicillin-binding transpeptidase domain-containing protein, partial [Betaproteobacteria bacterium]|nr:penicillin-binding transpeptidase domain-containing protein [Betaproteobacteria bacterium]